MPLSDPEDSPSTAIVFCDASSRPYYSFSGEWTMGMDWVLEELVIAAERKPGFPPHRTIVPVDA